MQIKAISELCSIGLGYTEADLPGNGQPELPEIFSKYDKLLVEVSTAEKNGKYDSQQINFNDVAKWINGYIGALNNKIYEISNKVFAADGNSLSSELRELSNKLATDNSTLSDDYNAKDAELSNYIKELSSNALLKNSADLQTVCSPTKFSSTLTANINGNATTASNATNANYASRAGTATNATNAVHATSADNADYAQHARWA